MPCYRMLLRRVQRDGESLEERKRKVLSIPAQLAVLFLSSMAWLQWLGLMGGQFASSVDAYGTGTFVAGVSTGCLLTAMLVTRRLPLQWIELWVTACIFALIMVDWRNAAQPFAGSIRVWGLAIVCVDLCLVLDVRSEASRAFVAITVVWLFICAAENALRIGLYDVGFVQPDGRQLREDCAKPPCPSGPVTGFLEFFLYSVIFLIDYQLTRDFASNLRGSVSLAQEISQALAQYDLPSAVEALDGAASTLPVELRTAYEELIQNLAAYKPFLPQHLTEVQGQATGPAAVVEPPTGKVAIMFTDIVGSTRFWEVSPEDMEEALNLHHEIVRREIAGHSGYEVKTIGDSFMCSFADPADAVMCGMSIQEALTEGAWPDVPEFGDVNDKWPRRVDAQSGAPVWHGIAVRIGVAFGDVKAEVDAVTQRTDYRGRAVNLASRCESCAPHGAVCISADCLDAVRSAASSRIADTSTEFVALPEQELKGIGVLQIHAATRPRLLGRVPYFLNFHNVRELPRLSDAACARSPSAGSPFRHQQQGGGAKDDPNTMHTISLHRCGTHMSPRRGVLDSRVLPQMSSSTSIRRSMCATEGRTRNRHSHCSSGVSFAASQASRMSPSAGSPSMKSRELTGAAKAVKPSHLERRLAVRMGAVAVVDGLGDTGHTDAVILSEALNADLAHCVAAALRSDGKLSLVAGAAAHAVWNVVAPCHAHRTQPLRFAALLRVVLDRGAVGIAAGQLLHGNVGTARQRWHTVYGAVQRVAEAEVVAAAQRRVTCLAAYLPSTPPVLHVVLRPVDVWGLPAHLGGRPGSESVTIECPDLDALQTMDVAELDAGAAAADDVAAPDPRQWRAAFARALAGADAVAELVGLAGGDRLLQHCAAQLHAHHAERKGAAASPGWRVPAPFAAAEGTPDGDDALRGDSQFGMLLRDGAEEWQKSSRRRQEEQDEARRRHHERLAEKKRERRGSRPAPHRGHSKGSIEVAELGDCEDLKPARRVVTLGELGERVATQPTECSDSHTAVMSPVLCSMSQMNESQGMYAGLDGSSLAASNTVGMRGARDSTGACL